MENTELSHKVEIEGSSKADGSRVTTGIEGFDGFVEGGFPRGSMIVLAGGAGSGKTVFASQYLYHGMSRLNESGVYLSLAESRNTYVRNMKRMGMDFEKYEQKGMFKFLDMLTVTGKGVDSIVERVLAEVDSLGAKRLVIDSFSALVQAFPEGIDARIMLHTVLGKLMYLKGVTTLLISERPLGTQSLGVGMEEFVADGIVNLRSTTEKGWLTRTLQVSKLRGTRINTEEHCYGIDEHGIRTYPLPELTPVQTIHSEKVPTGVEGLDKMFFGGVFKGSVTLIGGASGTGKTSFALQFIAEEAKRNGRGLYVSFEEPHGQLVREAEGLGLNMNELTDKGLVKFVNYSPEPFNIERQLNEIHILIKEYRPARLVIDTIGCLERIMAADRYFRYLKSLTLRLKDPGISAVFTVLTKSTTFTTGTTLSSTVDNIIALRLVDIDSSLRRSVVILKSRGTAHDNEIREFEITPNGVVLTGKFAGMEQVFGGTPRKSA
jgi:circadian clock protein KaiC